MGKSSLLQRFTYNSFSEFETNPTYGIEFLAKDIEINEKKIKLQIWDTVILYNEAGTEKYRSLARSYYRSAAGALVVFDVTKRSSFVKVQDWINEARVNGHNNMNFLLVGNKSDMNQDRQVLKEEAKDLAFREGFNYIETSARTALNVEKAFFELTMRVLDQVLTGKMTVDAEGSNGVKAGAQNNKTPKHTMNLNNSLVDKENEGGCCGS